MGTVLMYGSVRWTVSSRTGSISRPVVSNGCPAGEVMLGADDELNVSKTSYKYTSDKRESGLVHA